MSILKRLAAPKFWKIERKTKKFTISPRAGPHAKEACLPLGVVIRDYLKITENLKETKKLLNQRVVKVNGRVRTDHRFPVGLMDIIELGEEKAYRILPTKHGLDLKEIKDKDVKLSKIINKTCVKGGKIQLNLHEGWNVLIDSKDKDKFNTGDTLVFNLKKNEIKDIIKFKEGNLALIIGGSNIGKLGKIEKIKVIRSPHPNMVTLIVDGSKIAVPIHYVFVVGKDKPVIEL